MPMEAIGGTPVWVSRMGDASQLMIHCSLARHEALLPLAKALNEPTVLFDMPGHGRSAHWNAERDYQAETAQIAGDLCDAGPAHVIGHSFGATVALRLAIDHPSKVRRLTLIEPVFFAAARGTDGYAAHVAGFAPFLAAMESGDHMRAAEVFHGMWGQGPWARLPPRIQNDLAAHIHLIPAGGPAIESDNAAQLAPGVLEGVNVPVTLIRGSQTQAVISDIHARLSARLPNATDHVITGAGHMVALTHVAEVAAIMRAAERGTDRPLHQSSTSP